MGTPRTALEVLLVPVHKLRALILVAGCLEVGR